MTPILEKLARYLVSNGRADLGQVRIILPNRRSGLFLQRHLATLTRRVTWNAKIQPINELIGELSLLESGDPVEMVFLLYDLYRNLAETPEPLDEFFHRGEILLTDYDEMDKYLVDADMLFRNVIDLKEIEEPLAGLEDHQLAFIRQFWEGFHAGSESREKVRFIQFWKILPALYHDIRRKLKEKGFGYQGMQYREVVERIGRGELEPLQEKIIVVGFNALNACEKQLFTWLKTQGAEFFWDVDRAYVEDPFSEAGRFMRENISLFPSPEDLDHFSGLSQNKEIRIFELPSDVLQAKTLYRILQEKEHIPVADCTDTAVVLCDEELLMPVITSLPEQVEEINVTMGYPMRNSPVFGLIEALFRLQHNVRRSGDGRIMFYHKDVSAILLHPFMKSREGLLQDEKLAEIIRTNQIYVDASFFEGELERMIFQFPEESGTGLLAYLRRIFQQLLEWVSGEERQVQHELDREFVFRMLIHLNKLGSLLAERTALSPELTERLLRKTLSSIRIPFEGEPLAGIQVMGILETRLLDFRHVVLLSMNEELMPASHRRYSYIPYSLRLAFDLPAREEMDAIYAYYFYRLMQRADRVDLIYNSGSEGIRTGEMSRYLHQLIFARGLEVIRPGMDLSTEEILPVVVSHVPDIDQLLDRYRAGGTAGKYLSPSAVNTYLDCSLKFYLRYLAGIGETEEVREEIDAAGFGTVVHESIRVLYEEISSHHDGVLPAGELEKLMYSPHLEEVLRATFLKHHFHGKKSASIDGHNIIAFRIMLRYLQKIIQTDLGMAPITLVSAERTYQRTLSLKLNGTSCEVSLGGKIDRIDRKGGDLRVIDYKTGQVKQQFPSVESLFEADSNNRNSAAFQTLFYAWLVEEAHPGSSIMPGLYGLRALYESAFDPALHMGTRGDRIRLDTFAVVRTPFIEHLRETVQRIYD
ncbi:MAG: PD-(D/E)XK nuclease family protein, partial [Bacteroidales bacterium]